MQNIAQGIAATWLRFDGILNENFITYADGFFTMVCLFVCFFHTIGGGLYQQVRQWDPTYINTCRSYFAWYIVTVCVARALADSFDFELLREQKFTKMGNFLPSTPMYRRTKFDAASFIVGGEIHNRTNKQTHTHTHTHTRTANDFHTLPIGMCGLKIIKNRCSYRIIKLDTEIFHDECWKPSYFGVKRWLLLITDLMPCPPVKKY